ncbi:MAG: hypothetical protein JW759_01410 [Candidatus Coatesbacteria bacterium]|nr:hypothetical protein [Candidatus Coatesbacteria bacterium]
MKRIVVSASVFCLAMALQLDGQAMLYSSPPQQLSGVVAVADAADMGRIEDQTPERTFQDGILVALDGQGELLRDLSSTMAISPSAQESLGIVPDWLKMDLCDMFLRMSSSDQEDYGQLLLSIADMRLIDEVAFTIAHSSKSVLSRTDPSLYLRNAELLYQVDPEIPYADVVDYGEAGVDPDFYSTIRYRTVRDGEMSEFELPLDIYYWFVVHPKLGKEDPSMSPEPREDANTYGYFWREYLFYSPSEEYDYTNNYMTREPNMIAENDLDGWGPTAAGYLVDGSMKCPDGVIVGGPGIEKPLLVEYIWGQTARVIVTTMEVERARAAGKGELLENLVMRSNGQWGDSLLARGVNPDYYDQVAIVDGSGDWDILSSIQAVLDNNSIANWVMSLDDMLDPHQWDYFSKVIIPSHQSRAFYETMVGGAFMDGFTSWADNFRGTLEFHGACDAEQSWAGLELFKLGYASEELDDVAINGFPVLGEVIGNASYVWDDRVVNASLPGFRPFEPNSMAVDVIANWTSRMINFRARGSRPSQPNQICFEHDGNCGEIRYLLHAAARTCLLPTAGVCNNSWDHVTCEFWENGWHGYQVNFNVGSSVIADGLVLNDKDYGGTRDLSAIEQDRGDSFPVNATARYSRSCRFHAKVRDLRGNPVDCAEVRPWVRWKNTPSEPLDSPICAYTDSSGEVVIDLGDHRDFWFGVTSRAGDAPIEQLLTDTQEGTDYSHTWTVEEGAVPQLPEIDPMEFPSAPQPPYKLHISFSADYETLYSVSALTFAEKKQETANVDFFILDSENFRNYSQKEPFAAYEWRQDCQSDEFDVEVPDDRLYYLAFSNEDTLLAKQFVTIAVSVFQGDGQDWIRTESYSNFVGIPAQHSFVIMFNNKLGPSVYAAGLFNAEVDSSSAFELGVRAFVSDPDGLQDVRQVELCYGGVPLGKLLKDNGRSGDAIAGDGIFTFSERFMPGTLSPGVYKLEISATDMAGNKGLSWPYLNVLSTPLRLTEPTCTTNTAIWQPVATAAGAPVVLGGGYFGGEAVQAGDLVRIIAFVEDPDGLSDIDRVELFLEGGVPTGLLLHDDGADGDDHASDGIYTFQTFMPAGIPAGNLTLELVAFDKSGNTSARYPYFTVR